MSDDGTEQEPTQETTVANGGRNPLLSRIFAALANRRRRHVLYYLRDQNQAQLDDLATQIVAWEQEIPVSEVSADDVQRVSVELVHSHLPKLANNGLIEYDRRTSAVSYIYPPALLEEAIELTATLEKPQQ